MVKKDRKEKTIEWSAIGVMAFLLYLFVPRNRVRDAHVIFFFKHMITCFFGLLVVEKNLISYPSRLLFKKAVKSSFTFEYLVFPALCVLFNLYYPEKRNKLIKFLYYFVHSGIITGLEIVGLKYTDLIHYKKWKWYWTYITIWFTYFLSRTYFKWFTKEEMPNT
jgi:hypothetical protein